ncbi:MAG TPA: lamin tail domain-containing protein [Symbiobacteriaceae bacterium]
MPPSVVIAGSYSEPDFGCPPASHEEYVVLVNMGDRSVDMRGWSLTNRKRDDSAHHYRYHFPRFLSNGDPWIVEPGGMIILYTGRGTNGCTGSVGEARQFHLFQHRLAQIWQDAGDMVCLYDRHERLIHWWELPGVRRPV